MAKRIVGYARVQIEGGKATPAPPVGPALGQKGVNIMEFCKQFNERTKDKPGLVIPAVITVFEDKSFTFITKTPPASSLIKRAIKIDAGSAEPNKKKVGRITKAQLAEIAKLKMEDLNTDSLEAAIKIIAGSAKSMGVTVID
ncbi:MAG: 50S ribosomal protein L11 [Caldisericota bacterium]|jgi:large subunit ribosomal protein L11|nr:50S ribosomal protein L11 [Caldisericota bacterium]